MCERVCAALVVLGALAALIGGCGDKQSYQLMAQTPRYEPLEASDFFADGGSARPLVPGTVARGHVADDSLFATGVADGHHSSVLPFGVTRALLERGRGRFNIYCAPCHSRVGDGRGMVVRRGFTSPPSLHIDRLRSAPIGHFFHVMTEGFGAMPEYAKQLELFDRWAIAAYIRALQLSQHAGLGDVPPGDRAALDTAESGR
jgi:hypothetical protein